MATNKIPFDDTTNYPDVYRIDKLMFGDITARGTKCCQSKQTETALCTSLKWLYAAQVAEDNGETERFEQAVKAAYLTLYPFSLDQDYNYQPL